MRLPRRPTAPAAARTSTRVRTKAFALALGLLTACGGVELEVAPAPATRAQDALVAPTALLGLHDVEFTPAGIAEAADLLGGRGWVMQVAYSTDLDWAPALAAGAARAAAAGLTPVIRVDYARAKATAWADGTPTAGATLPLPGDNPWCLVRNEGPGRLGPSRPGGSHLGCYLDFLEQLLRSPGGDAVQYLVIGNEFNVSSEALAFPEQTLDPAWVATVYRAARTRVHSLPGHANTKVFLGAVSPGDATHGPAVEGRRTRSGRDTMTALLGQLDPSELDGFTLHAYGGWVLPADNGNEPALQVFERSLREQIEWVDALGHARTPLLLTEWSGRVHLPTDRDGTAKRRAGVPKLAQFIRDAARAVHAWNQPPGRHDVLGAIYFSLRHEGFQHEHLAPFRELGGPAHDNPWWSFRAVARDEALPAGDPAHAGTCARPPAGPQRCFAESGRCLPALFAETWSRHGGLPVFGLPIDDADCKLDPVTGRVLFTQWLQRQRFEYHPEHAADPRYVVQLARLGVGDALAAGVDPDAWQRCTPGERQGVCECLGPPGPEPIGHWVCGELLAHWQGHGMQFDRDPSFRPDESLALLGYPISPERTIMTPLGERAVQWFERARLERHPDHCGPRDARGRCSGAHYVQAGLLGCVAGGFTPGSRLGC